jgi:Mg2+ and Co2+ transporter CorA
MTSAVQRNQADLNAALTDSAASIQRTLDSSEKCIISITTAASDALRENQKSIGNAVNENLIAMKTGVQTTQQEMTKASSEFDRHVKGLIQGTKDQVAELDRALATELTKSLESLARQFTSISDQFAKDYTPLANELRKIVEIAKKVVG